MTQNNVIESGQKEYESKVKNLEGIFKKIEKILDISEYRQELERIKNEVHNDPDLLNKMLSSNMQLDYEGFIYGKYTKMLNELTEKIEGDAMPFYELYLLFTKINIQIAKISCDNISEIIENTKVLIDKINSLNTNNNEQKNLLISKAYETIYSVIVNEEMFDRSDILSYISHLNLPSNKENIGRLLANDLKSIDEEDLVDENLRSIKYEGLGYDYLNPEFVRKVSINTVGKTNSEYQERKKRAIYELSERKNNIISEQERLKNKLSNNDDKIRHFYINKAFFVSKALSLVLVPILAFNIGRAIGKSVSNKTTEYKTITRTVDLETGRIVGNVEEVYDENETTYVATVMSYSPWRKNPVGVGYIRNATAYEYITPSDIKENYHPTRKDLENNVFEKYSFIESKDELGNEDSTENSTILITETYQDKNDSRKSTKFVIPFSIIGIGAGLVIDFLLIYFGVYDFNKIKRNIEKLDTDIKQYKLSNKQINDRLVQMREDTLLLQNDYNDTIKKYGILKDEIIFDDKYASLMQNNQKGKILIKKYH